MIVLSNSFYVDSNDNKWSINSFSKEEVEEISSKMILANNHYCVNCVDCVECIKCNGCVECDGCSFCDDCYRCRRCERSNSCDYCTACDDCSNCVDCRSSRKCTHCTYCNRCSNCTLCENSHDMQNLKLVSSTYYDGGKISVGFDSTIKDYKYEYIRNDQVFMEDQMSIEDQKFI